MCANLASRVRFDGIHKWCFCRKPNVLTLHCTHTPICHYELSMRSLLLSISCGMSVIIYLRSKCVCESAWLVFVWLSGLGSLSRRRPAKNSRRALLFLLAIPRDGNSAHVKCKIIVSNEEPTIAKLRYTVMHGDHLPRKEACAAE